MVIPPAAAEAAEQGGRFDKRHVDEEAQARGLSCVRFASGLDQVIAGTLQCGDTIFFVVSIRSSLRLRHKTLQFWFGR